MLARVSTFEGGTADGVRAAVEQLRSDLPKGPPEGVKSNGLTVLIDPDGGRMMFIGLFAAPIAGVARLRLAFGFWVLAVTITIGVGAVIMISLVASRPSSRGMWISIVTTSGRSVCVSATASRPSHASPTTRISGSDSRIFTSKPLAVAE